MPIKFFLLKKQLRVLNKVLNQLQHRLLYQQTRNSLPCFQSTATAFVKRRELLFALKWKKKVARTASFTKKKVKIAQKCQSETWTSCHLIDLVKMNTFNGGFLTEVSTNNLIFWENLGLYFSCQALSWRIQEKKEIYEVKVWTSKAIQPSNGIQNHKSKNDFKFNFVFISQNTNSWKASKKFFWIPTT